MTDKMETLTKALRDVKAHYPYRIVWGFIGDDGTPEVYASHNRRARNKAIREGKQVFELK